MDAMQTTIHPTSIVEPGAYLGSGVKIGPFCHVTSNVHLGDGVELLSHVSVTGHTSIGNGSRVFPMAVLGAEPQNAAYKGEDTKLIIGANNTIREGVTMHLGTGNARGQTVVGDNGMFLAHSHVAHDCIVGNNVTFANNVMLAGHVVVGDYVIVGGGAGIHQFCNIGTRAFVGGMAAVEADVIPFGMVLGNRAYLGGLNLVGMKRSGMSREDINAMRHAYVELFETDAGSLRENAAAVLEKYSSHQPVCDLVNVILTSSKRKFVTTKSARKSRMDDAQ